MHIRLSLLLLAFTLVTSLSAQKKIFTLDDVISGGKNYSSFTPETISNLKWIEGTNTYSYANDSVLFVVDVKTGKEKIVFELDQIEKIVNEDLDEIPSHQWLSANELLLNMNSSKTVINIEKKNIQSSVHFPLDADNIDYNSKSQLLAYTLNNNLFIATTNLAKVTVTNDSNTSIVNGKPYHRYEFGISKGTFWSPDGNYLAFARKDESMVGDYPLVDIESREATLENIKYPMAGMASHEVSIGIYQPSTGEIIYLQTGEPKDQYLTNLAWSSDEKTVYLAVLNREQNHMKLNSYSAVSGEYISTLFEETNEHYVEPQQALVWLPNNTDLFLWQSDRDGHTHLYLYNTKGDLIKQLTSGAWDVTDFQGFDNSGKYLFYTSTQKSPIERHSYRLTIKTGQSICLTKEVGTHYTKMASSGDYVLDNWSNRKTPRKIDLFDVDKQTTKNLLTAKDPYADFNLGDTKIFTIKAADDSTDLYCRMITPPGYDAAKKYPVIVYVYGGPHAQLVHEQWMGAARMWQHYMAQKGYIAFTLDNRGSAGRGRDFEQVIHRQLGKAEMADQMKGIDYLKSLPFVDQDRIGVHGWSYGGFMTTSLMTTFPETFKVGVAGGPVIDWKYYEIMYGERYMDAPQENPEGYENASLLNKVTQLEGRLLIIHGAIDPTVVWQHSMAFVRECVKENVQVDYFVYPCHEHNVRGKDRIHLMGKVTRYFDDFL
jgi:dipeptidyl-peptidase-4